MIALASPPPFLSEDRLLSTVSASRLNTFHTCRLKFCFRYVQELAKPGAVSLFVGKAVHAALQHWNTARWRGEPFDEEIIRQAFLAHWTEALQEEELHWEEEATHQAKAWALVELYLRETPIPTEEKPTGVEVQVEVDLSSHGLTTLVGIIDLVRPGGRIVDFKTSSTTPNSAQAFHRNETQLTCYGLLYRDATGENETALELHHLVKTKTPRLVVDTFDPITEGQKTKLFRSIESYLDGVQREDFVPSPGLHCAACEFFAECRAWKGNL